MSWTERVRQNIKRTAYFITTVVTLAFGGLGMQTAFADTTVNVSGTVMGTDDSPVPNAAVEFYIPNPDGSKSNDIISIANSNGNYSANLTPADDYTVAVSGSPANSQHYPGISFSNAWDPVQYTGVSFTSSQTFNATLTVYPSYTFSGSIIDNAGRAVGGTDITFTDATSGTSANLSEGTFQNAFSMRLRAGLYTVRVQNRSGLSYPLSDTNGITWHLTDATQFDLTGSDLNTNIQLPPVNPKRVNPLTLTDRNDQQIFGGYTVGFQSDPQTLVGAHDTFTLTESGAPGSFSIHSPTILNQDLTFQPGSYCAYVTTPQETACNDSAVTIGAFNSFTYIAPNLVPPINFKAAASPTSQPAFSWYPEHFVDHYVISRELGPNPANVSTPIATLPGDTTTFTDTTVPADGVYQYYLEAVDADGTTAFYVTPVGMNQGTPYISVTVDVPPSLTNLAVSPSTIVAGDNAVITATTDGVGAYVFDDVAGPGRSVPMTLTGNTLSLDTTSLGNLQPGIHTIVVRAYDGTGNLSDQRTVTLTVLTAAPNAPTGLTVTSPTQQPVLTWQGVSGATYYNIYRNGSLLDTISSSNTTYADTAAPEGTNTYYVTAKNANGGESGQSNTINVLVDRTAPTITYAVTPVADSNGNNTGNVTVTFTCTDNSGGSDIAACSSPVTVDNEGIGHTVDGTATDNAGNSTTIHANASLLVQAINAGGGAASTYSADTDFTGGQAYSSNATVDTSSVTAMPAPQAVYQTVRYGNAMTYTLPGLTPDAAYTLRLHFNELYWGVNGNGGDGSRVFNVAVNGTPVLTNFDIYKAAGGANTAIVEELPVTADASGNVTVQFTTVTDNAMVSGIELYQGTLPAEPPAQTSPTITSARVNAGGDTVGDFAADTGFSGGQTYTSSTSVDTSGVTNPAPEAVYQSVRYGNFTYAVQNLAPNANHLVRLHFNEPYWTASGSRVFNVSINGTQVLTNFDVYQTAGGANKAITEGFVVPSDSHGTITINFTGVTDNAMVSGIEIEQPSVPTPTYYTGNDGANFSRSDSPGGSGVATQTVNSDSSISLNINNAPSYADTGFAVYHGRLGDLPNFTVNGTGHQFGLNLWFDSDSNGSFFQWDSNGVLTGLGGDTYGLSSGSSNGSLAVNSGTSFFMMDNGQSYTLAQLADGSDTTSGINADTVVTVWIGVDVNSGSASTTITSIDGL